MSSQVNMVHARHQSGNRPGLTTAIDWKHAAVQNGPSSSLRHFGAQLLSTGSGLAYLVLSSGRNDAALRDPASWDPSSSPAPMAASARP